MGGGDRFWLDFASEVPRPTSSTHSYMLAWRSILIQNLAFYLIDCFSTFKILNLYMYIIRNLYELFG